MKMVPILGLGGTPPGGECCTPPTTFEGSGILSFAIPDDEHARRKRALTRYLEKRAGYIHAGNDTIH
jgi:hypothetical protein